MKKLFSLIAALLLTGCAYQRPAKEAFPVKQGQEITYSFKQRNVACIVPEDKTIAMYCWR